MFTAIDFRLIQDGIPSLSELFGQMLTTLVTTSTE